MENKKSMGKLCGVALRLLYKIKTYYNVIANILISYLYYSLMWNNIQYCCKKYRIEAIK